MDLTAKQTAIVARYAREAVIKYIHGADHPAKEQRARAFAAMLCQHFPDFAEDDKPAALVAFDKFWSEAANFACAAVRQLPALSEDDEEESEAVLTARRYRGVDDEEIGNDGAHNRAPDDEK